MNLTITLSKIAFSVIFVILLNNNSFSQNMEVKSFVHLQNDMDARVHFPKKDQNGDKCAILKIVTPETGFVFEGGTMGIVEAVQKTSEVWVYIPHGSKRITIKHPNYGVLRNYVYPEAINEASVYEIVLTTNKPGTTDITGEWVIINSEPSGAKLYINDYLVGTTPFQKKYKEGIYKYKLQKDRFQTVQDTFTLDYSKGVKNLRISLPGENMKVMFSVYPGNANVFIDDDIINKLNDSITVKAGGHIIKAQKEGYIDFEDNAYFDSKIKGFNVLMIPEKYHQKSTALIYSTIFPGLGQTHLTRSKIYSTFGVVSYGLLAGSLVMHNSAVKNYDLYIKTNNPDELDKYKANWQSDISLSRTLGFSAAGIWAANLVWVLIMPSEKEMYDKLKLQAGYHPGSGTSKISMVYKF